jgi:FAD/FMN-containing dehydrogenase
MAGFIQKLIDILGTSGVITDPRDTKPYLTDWRGIFHGTALAIVFPKTTADVQLVVQLCIEHDIAIIPQGGNTNLTGSSTPEPVGQQIVLSLKRLNQIRSIDLENQAMTVEAGCILQSIQEKAFELGLLFPLSLAAEGSCTIGGNLATNAGGINVLRYGNMRDLCLGIEAVTASGEILHSLRGLRKDNTGYDLRNLLIGSEGTLGIITAAVIKLYPAPINRCAALIAINDYSIMVNLLQELQRKATNELCAFEMMSRESLDLTVHHFPQFANPIFQQSSHTLLIELAEFSSESRASQILEDVLGYALEKEQIEDVLISTSLSQVQQFWGIREHITLAQAKEQANIKFDISFEISKIGDFITHTCQLLRSTFPGIRIINFGHFGDGNLHFNLCPPIGSDKDFLKINEGDIHRIVYAQIEKYQGSISAEHGIGQLKRNDLETHRGTVAYQMMKKIKQALDPQNILNPHKVLL